MQFVKCYSGFSINEPKAVVFGIADLRPDENKSDLVSWLSRKYLVDEEQYIVLNINSLSSNKVSIIAECVKPSDKQKLSRFKSSVHLVFRKCFESSYSDVEKQKELPNG